MDLSRNLGILTKKEMQIIATKKLAVIGLGLGSLIAQLCVRSGFKNLVIADGDIVDSSNLNRQAYSNNDIGRKKTEATKAYLRGLADDLTIKSHDNFLVKDDVDRVMEESEIIVDSIDLSSLDVILAIHKWARDRNVPVIFPINLGWSSIIMVFSKHSATLENVLSRKGDMGGLKKGNFETWVNFLESHVPQYGKERFDSFLSKMKAIGEWCPAPQLGVTAHATAALTVTLALKIALGEKTPVAPQEITSDLFVLTS